MRFSVLLPTRNGGAFLENCIRSVLEQDHDDFELVISDNANTDATADVIRAFAGDPRVKATRTETVLSVTENWNNALQLASGDYILMLGDDDCLLPGYFRTMSDLIDRYDAPDCIVHNAYSYVAPGSIGDDPASYFSEAHFRFGDDLTEERRLDASTCRSIVADMFRFHVRIPLNMQTTLVSRRAAALVPGGLFQPPFPDHFALNSLLLLTDRWVFSPARPLVVGVSPKSFGHYVYSNEQAGGLSYLGIRSDFPGRLPGSELTNGMYAWLIKLKETYGDRLAGVTIDRPGYVRRQVYAWFTQWRLGYAGLADFLGKFAHLTFADWLGLAASVFDRASWRQLGRAFAIRSGRSVQSQLHRLQRLADVRDIRAFAFYIAHPAGADRAAQDGSAG